MSKTKIILILIVLLASFLRLWKINEVPISLFGDEVDVGYQAYSILHTGRDYMGQFLPLYVHSLAEWRAPLFIYSTIPFVAIFGLNESGVRLAAAFFGILSVYLIYALGKELKDEKYGLVAAVLLAILPWHIHYSRAAFEVTLLVALLLGALLCFIQKKYVFSGILFALTFYTYNTAVVFTPLYILALVFFGKNHLEKTRFDKFLVPFFLLILPFVYLTLFGPTSSRFSLLSIFNSDRILDQINIERSEVASSWERLFHNKAVGWSGAFATNYVKSMSPEFLFVHGDPLPRHTVPETGVLFWGYLPLLFAGFLSLVLQKHKYRYLVISWLFLASIPASLTVDGGYHATRLFLQIPPLVLIAAYGWRWLAEHKSVLTRISITTVQVFLILNTIWFLHRYFVHYPLQQWKYWHYGYKQAMLNLDSIKDNYNTVFINNTHEPSLLHFLFWTKYDPQQFQKDFRGDIPQDEIFQGFNGFRLGEKYYFGETSDVFNLLKPGTLYLAAQGKEIPGDWDLEKNPPKDIKVTRVIRDPQGKPLFILISK